MGSLGCMAPEASLTESCRDSKLQGAQQETIPEEEPPEMALRESGPSCPNRFQLDLRTHGGGGLDQEPSMLNSDKALPLILSLP